MSSAQIDGCKHKIKEILKKYIYKEYSHLILISLGTRTMSEPLGRLVPLPFNFCLHVYYTSSNEECQCYISSFEEFCICYTMFLFTVW